MKYLKVLLLVISVSIFHVTQAQDEVSITVSDTSGSKKVIHFDWSDDKGDKPMISVINAALSQNGGDCPAKRIYMGKNTWRCANGRIVSTKDGRVAKLLGEVWGN
jgi:hypothetical protein